MNFFKLLFLDSESDMTGNDENGGGMNQSIIESATREHVYTGFVDPRKCSTQKTVFTETYDTFQM